ncbi:hypothetical protein B0H63DRAFT_99473 [Podospora didyma]|uniref:Zn(2)-C6 fungal-type domain-containing protein n=1 Tax=Podospora didyma TaxID=330526 RepID=A0AAE0U3Q9_9PEZI|nr:hypothetical protein B0H63DRAFT_99473 [Podospora didyma]
MASVVRSTALRAGGACVRCRKGKTKCVYENGRAPCKNCAKGMHECYLPSESMSHGGHGVSPARTVQRTPRESLPSERAVSGTSGSERQPPPVSSVSRHVTTTSENASSRSPAVPPFFSARPSFPKPSTQFSLAPCAPSRPNPDFLWLALQRQTELRATYTAQSPPAFLGTL